jgi:hypothetical protein
MQKQIDTLEGFVLIRQCVNINPNSMKRSISLLILVAAISCNEKSPVTGTPPAIDEASTRAVLEHHWKTFAENDLVGVMEDYAEESVLITPDKTFVGLDEIRENFEFAFTLFPRDSTRMVLQKTIIEGDLAYIIWSAESPKLNLGFGTDSFVIRDGKIIRQTYAGVAKE